MATTKPQTYTVVQGDSLSLISKKMYGDFSMVDALIEANPTITNPNLIYPGQQLIIPVPAKSVETSTVPAASSSGSGQQNASSNTTTTIKTTVTKYIGWGFGLLALMLLAYEANKQHKKNKAAKKPATAEKKLSGVKRPRKKKVLAGTLDVDELVTYIKNDDQLKDKPASAATISEAVRKFNREFPGDRLSLTADDKERVLEKLK